MTKVHAPLLLLLAACSSQPDAPVAQNAAAPASPSPAATPTSAPAPVADSGAAPAPGELETFRDWTVACDNVRRCAMASLGPDLVGDFPPYTMQVARAAGPAGGFEIAIDALQDDAAAPATIVIDGRRFALAPDGLAGKGAAAIVAAMVEGRTLDLLGAGGARLGQVSLAGASAALRYVDAGQGRAGGVTAAVAKGERAADAVPPAPAIPVVSAPALGGAAARPSAAQLAEMRRLGRCEERMADTGIWEVKTGALGGGATIVLLPCSAGAYNEIDALFVVRDGKVAPADVDSPSGFEETGADSQTPVHSVINGEVALGLVSSFAKGRGLGDCGVAQRYAWDGRRLRLVEQNAMGECRGNPNYLRTWIARVERR